MIGRAYFLVLNKIDEPDGTNERLLKYYKENIEKIENYAIINPKAVILCFTSLKNYSPGRQMRKIL